MEKLASLGTDEEPLRILAYPFSVTTDDSPSVNPSKNFSLM